MVDPVTLKEALDRFDNPDSLEDWAANRSMDLAHGILAAAAREYLSFLEDSPTDEDVEIAAKAMYVWERTLPSTGQFAGRPWSDDNDNTEYYQAARVALRAVAEARRQS